MAHVKPYVWFFLALHQNLSLPLALALSYEGTILVQVKQILADKSNSLANWNLSDENPSAWTGISYDDSRSVMERSHGCHAPRKSELCDRRPSKSDIVGSSAQRFQGPFPAGLSACKKFQVLDLSYKSFSGSIPYEIISLAPPNTLRLDHNLFEDEIAQKIYFLEQFNRLSLANYRIYGHIPGMLGSFPALVALDLSHNELEEATPVKLGDLKLSEFNVSYNDLYGRVPDGLNKLAFKDCFLGNPTLCGGGALKFPPCA